MQSLQHSQGEPIPADPVGHKSVDDHEFLVAEPGCERCCHMHEHALGKTSQAECKEYLAFRLSVDISASEDKEGDSDEDGDIDGDANSSAGDPM